MVIGPATARTSVVKKSHAAISSLWWSMNLDQFILGSRCGAVGRSSRWRHGVQRWPVRQRLGYIHPQDAFLGPSVRSILRCRLRLSNVRVLVIGWLSRQISLQRGFGTMRVAAPVRQWPIYPREHLSLACPRVSPIKSAHVGQRDAMAELASQNRILRRQILVSEAKLLAYASRSQCHGFDGLHTV